MPEYYSWLVDQVCDPSSKYRYSRLLYKLYDTEFTWKIPQDVNRARDGLDLRREFSYSYYDDSPCSVLEVMVALANRIEIDILSEPDLGNRAPEWFWEMIYSLDLHDMTNANYNDDYVDFIIFRFLNREYDSNGRGGLFTVDHPRVDMRRIEIWYQMQNWLNNEF